MIQARAQIDQRTTGLVKIALNTLTGLAAARSTICTIAWGRGAMARFQ